MNYHCLLSSIPCLHMWLLYMTVRLSMWVNGTVQSDNHTPAGLSHLYSLLLCHFGRGLLMRDYGEDILIPSSLHVLQLIVYIHICKALLTSIVQILSGKYWTQERRIFFGVPM